MRGGRSAGFGTAATLTGFDAPNLGSVGVSEWAIFAEAMDLFPQVVHLGEECVDGGVGVHEPDGQHPYRIAVDLGVPDHRHG